MNHDRAFEHALDDWLVDGTDRAPRPAVDAVLLAIRTTPQERGLRAPWRNPTMATPLRLVAAIAIVAVVGVGGLYFLDPGSRPGVGGQPASPSPTATPGQSATPSPSPSPSPALTDPATWPTYTSSQYGFEIGHPAGWTVTPATRAWTFDADAADHVLTVSADAFTASTALVRVNAWALPLDDGAPLEGWEWIGSWAETYCQQAGLADCAGVPDRTVPMCVELRDCHAGAVVVPFETEVQAFILGGDGDDDGDSDQMIVVSVWRAETDRAVAPYGGSRALLEAFLQTMNVWPTEDNR
jgi:hypothetical protein